MPINYPNGSNTCIIDFVVDNSGNFLMRNYRDTLYMEKEGTIHRLDIPTHSPGTVLSPSILLPGQRVPQTEGFLDRVLLDSRSNGD